MIIRPPEPRDKDQMMDMARAMHAESPRFRNEPFSGDKFSQVLDHLIRGLGICFVAEDDGGLVGMAGGVLGQPPFSDYLYATDLGIYLRPEARGRLTAVRLVKAFEEFAFTKGAEEVILGISCDIEKMDGIKSFYEKLGYSLTSCAMIKTREQFNVQQD